MMEQVSKEKLMLAVEHGVDEIIVKPLKLGDIRPKMASAFKIYYNPNNPDQVYELAKKYLRDQDFTNAEAVYTQLLINAPKTARPLVGLARVCHAKSESSRALDYLGEAEKNNPYYVHLFSLRGQILCDQGDYDAGLKALYHAVELSPLNPLRYQDAVNQLTKRKEHDKIASLLDSAVKQGVQFPELYRFLSEAFYNLKDYKKAIRYIRTALDTDQNNVTFLNQLAISLKESGETAESIKIYNKVIKNDPDNLQALFNKSILYSQTGQVDEAMKILERLVKKHPDFDRARQKYDELKTANPKAS
jgi:tetratricopeptide (TPR) repeat protein